MAVPMGGDSVGTGTHASPGDVVSLVLIAIAAALWRRDCGRGFGRARIHVGVTLLLAGLVGASAVSMICSADPATSLVGWVRETQVLVLVPLAVLVSLRDRRDVAVVVASVLALGTGEAVFGIWQTVTHNGASYAGELVRAVGTFGALDVMAMATVCGIALVAALSLALTTKRGWRRAGLLVVAVVLSVALVCSLSRGSWIAASVGAAVVLLRFDAKLALKLGLCTAAVFTIVVGGFGIGSGMVAERTQSILHSVHDPDRSVGDRYALWSTAEGMWQDHPVAGVGLKNFPAFRDAYAPPQLSGASDTDDSVTGFVREPLLSPHNQYLLMLAEQGLLGAGASILALGGLLVGLWRRARPADGHWLLCLGVTAATAVNFLYSDMGGPTTVLIGIVLGLAARHTYPVASRHEVLGNAW
ncbi:O-antigen ligase family protein [Actinomadura rupiterrae]|uniref:O-antigen ligase family protein n=1 Tax=Actinomadura rupiterrae TaxID=559627 RepID=UPI0020A360DB|nr:O-antigen ligase family protein [Actinomadura rupiterrae]MCP2335170.1 O-antigen ligase [Actinomadura rupiterrae]